MQEPQENDPKQNTNLNSLGHHLNQQNQILYMMQIPMHLKQKFLKDQHESHSVAKHITLKAGDMKAIVKILWRLKLIFKSEENKLDQSKDQIIDQINHAIKKLAPFIQYSQTLQNLQSFVILSRQQHQNMRNQVRNLLKQKNKSQRQLQAIKSSSKALIEKYKQLKVEVAKTQNQTLEVKPQKCFKIKNLRLTKLYSLKYTNKHVQNDYLKLDILLSNNNKLRMEVSKSMNVKTLKTQIHEACNDLLPSQMILQFKGKDLKQSDYLADIFQNNKAQVIQRKAELWQIPELKSNKNEMDLITCTMGVAHLACFHAFSRETMRQIVNYQLETMKNYQILCPHTREYSNLICNYNIPDNQCRLIAGYDFRQWEKISEKKSINFITENTIQCPKCCQMVYVLKDKRVGKFKCPYCSGFQFCVQCRQIWKGQNICQSQMCSMIRSSVNSQKNLKNKDQNHHNSSKGLNVHKLCPNCEKLIWTPSYCNLFTCNQCQKKFCFICLQPYSEQTGWTCDQTCQRYKEVTSGLLKIQKIQAGLHKSLHFDKQ